MFTGVKVLNYLFDIISNIDLFFPFFVGETDYRDHSYVFLDPLIRIEVTE